MRLKYMQARITNHIPRISHGFTLIELLVVISIIGLLASVVLVSLNSARKKSRDAKRLTDVRQIMTGLELYYNTCNSYPTNAVTLGTTKYGISDACTNWVASASLTGNAYLKASPGETLPVETGCTTGGDAAAGGANNAYDYYGGTSTVYNLEFCLGAATGGFAPGQHTATHAGIN